MGITFLEERSDDRRIASSMNVALWGCVSVALLHLTACGADAVANVAPPFGVASYIALASDPGEPLAGGAAYDYSTATARITARPLGAQLAMRVVGDRVWDGSCVPERRDATAYGQLPGLTNSPPIGGAGFRWSSQELTCTSSIASVTIDSLKYDGESLRSIDLRFKQRCNGQSAALRGIVHWRASDDLQASGPVVPAPAALWRAPAGAVPATGNYVYLDGSVNLGPDISLPQTLVPGPFSVRATGGTLAIVAFDSVKTVGMIGNFQGMIGLTSIREGYYRDLRGLGELPSVGALDVGVNAWDCASLVGWFVIDHQFYFLGGLTTVDLRFELRCNGLGAPLRGQIHWAE